MRRPARGQEEGPPVAGLPWLLGPSLNTCHTWSRAAAQAGRRPRTIPPLRLRTRASPCSSSPPRGSPLPFLLAEEPHPDVAQLALLNLRISPFSSRPADPERPSPRPPRPSWSRTQPESAARARPSRTLRRSGGPALLPLLSASSFPEENSVSLFTLGYY